MWKRKMNKIQVRIDEESFDVDVQVDPRSGITATIAGEALPVTFGYHTDGSVAWALVGGRSYEIELDPQLHWLHTTRSQHRLELHDREAQAQRPASGDGRVKAPIPGTVARVLVRPGEAVAAGQPLLVLEAMKMENEIRAPRSGAVEQLNVAVGQSVTLGTVMVEIG